MEASPFDQNEQELLAVAEVDVEGNRRYSACTRGPSGVRDRL